MEFTLHYRGALKANRSPAEKHQLRKHFHIQLKQLWTQRPLSIFTYLLNPSPARGELSVIREIGKFRFAPLVSERIHLIAELEILMLRPEPPGSIVTQGGDIDNRLKTLLDALKVPAEPTALPQGATPEQGEDPFFCLLEDDSLITKISVDTDRLLELSEDPSEVVLLIHVITKQLAVLSATIGLA